MLTPYIYIYIFHIEFIRHLFPTVNHLQTWLLQMWKISKIKAVSKTKRNTSLHVIDPHCWYHFQCFDLLDSISIKKYNDTFKNDFWFSFFHFIPLSLKMIPVNKNLDFECFFQLIWFAVWKRWLINLTDTECFSFLIKQLENNCYLIMRVVWKDHRLRHKCKETHQLVD